MTSEQAIPLAVAVVGLLTAVVQTHGKQEVESREAEVVSTLARVVEQTARGLPCESD